MKPSSSVSTSTASESSVNMTEQTARDELEVEILPVSHSTPRPANYQKTAMVKICLIGR